MAAQEKREEAQLDRLQGLADIEALRQAGAFSSGIGGLTEGLTSAISPFIKPDDPFFQGMSKADGTGGYTYTGGAPPPSVEFGGMTYTTSDRDWETMDHLVL